MHFHKGFGAAEISAESMLDWCKRWHPSEVAGLAEYLRSHPDPLYLDFEPTLHGLEQLQGYQAIMEVARNESILSAAHQGFLACGLMMHAMRSYEFSTSMLKVHQGKEPSKWQYLWLLKTAWANELVLARAVVPLVMGEWTLWSTGDSAFPLCDSPVVMHKDGLFAVISPRLLLEIDLTVPRPEGHWISRHDLPPEKLHVLRRGILSNTFKELIASDRVLAENWRSDPQCRKRISVLSTEDGREAAIAEAADRVIWGVMGFGRVPDDFEEWAPAVSEAILQSDKGRALLVELRSRSGRAEM